jgi:hypothetical protein
MLFLAILSTILLGTMEIYEAINYQKARIDYIFYIITIWVLYAN